MTTADLLYLALVVALLSVDAFALWPAFVRRSSTDPGRARRWIWSCWIMMLWTMTAVGMALWLWRGRDWESLRLVAPHGWRMWVAIALVAGVAWVHALPVMRLAKSKRPRRVKMGHAGAERLVPRTGAELGWWLGLSLSAGFCEEFVFRGYLIWLFQPFLGLWGAAALSLVMFALAHAYQGAKGIVMTGIVGAVLTLVVLILGSLWPAIALHALIDIGQGLLAWVALRGGSAGNNQSPK